MTFGGSDDFHSFNFSILWLAALDKWKVVEKKIKHQYSYFKMLNNLDCVSLKMWIWKFSLVPGMSSKVQTSPTFKLLSFTNVFHPLEISNFVLPWLSLIRNLAGQTLSFNTQRWISPRFLLKSKCLLPNADGIFYKAKEKVNC